MTYGVIAINPVNYSDRRRSLYQNEAIKILINNIPDDFVVLSCLFPNETTKINCKNSKVIYLERNSRNIIGNNRDLPYIKDIFSFCNEINCHIFGYINSDIILSKDFFNILKRDKDAYIFYRREIGETNVERFNAGDYHRVWGGDKHEGNDSFFFNKDWWDNNSNLFPDDLILGETEWDTCYRTIIVSETKNYYVGRDLCHIFHDQKWDCKSPGAINNLNIFKNVLKKYPLCKNALP